ncbi:TRAP transporter small permease [Eubacteriales bacterium OttesenSCG-928-K08]|nr:TRAP transporter small permease [Eubacteriales bacterium OttesenSCG-928-K08]
MKRYLKILDFIENVIMATSMIVMLGITFINVIIRKFTTTSFAFTEEVVTSLFILLTLVSAAAVARRGGHIGLSALTDMLPKKIQKFVALLSAAVSVFFSALLVYYGYLMALGEFKQGMLTAALQWPEWIFGSFVPIGGLFMALEFINYAILAFKGTQEAPPSKDESAASLENAAAETEKNLKGAQS